MKTPVAPNYRLSTLCHALCWVCYVHYIIYSSQAPSKIGSIILFYRGENWGFKSLNITQITNQTIGELFTKPVCKVLQS